MAWSSPRTWTTGEIITAAIMNQDIRDNEIELNTGVSVVAASGTDTLTITTGGDFTYSQGRKIQFKAAANNTGNMTINVDSKGAKSFLNPDGTELAAGKIKADKIYEAYYDTASGGRFFLLARTMGDAVAANVLAAKKFSNDIDVNIVGTMPNQATGGYKECTDQSYSSGRIYLRPPAGYWDGVNYTYKDDANFIAANIKKDVPLFGITGTCDPYKTASGTVTSSSGTSSFTNKSGSGEAKYSLTVSGLAFQPKAIFITSSAGTSQTIYSPMLLSATDAYILMQDGTLYKLVLPASITATGFVMPVFNGSTSYNWYAIG